MLNFWAARKNAANEEEQRLIAFASRRPIAVVHGLQ
jgi:hypothetical protein